MTECGLVCSLTPCCFSDRLSASGSRRGLAEILPRTVAELVPRFNSRVECLLVDIFNCCGPFNVFIFFRLSASHPFVALLVDSRAATGEVLLPGALVLCEPLACLL